MKIHALYEPIPIIKETEKAVCIKNKEVSDAMQDVMILEQTIYKVPFNDRIRVNGKPFWLPKSQIETKDNFVVGITKWFYNQMLLFADCPIVTKEDVEYFMKEN